MDPFAAAIKRMIYPAWAWKNGNARLQYLSQMEESQYWQREKLREYQRISLKRLVTHAYETCPYYREKFLNIGATPDDFQSIEDFKRFPTIAKEEIQENKETLISSKYSKSRLIKDMTGGSTGSPLVFYYEQDRRESREAASFRHDRWAGWDIGSRRAIIWGAPQDIKITGNVIGKLKAQLRWWIIDRSLILDAACLDEATMHAFARKLIHYKPTVIQAYANTLGLFARYLNSENIKGITPKGIICSAEVLTAENRSMIENTFNSPVYNRYGSREFGVIASECSQHEGMHINAENLFVEVLPQNGTNNEQEGEIAVTDLKNMAMPLIRYKIKDMGRLKNEPCSCSRGLPLMELTGGRVTDFLTASNGSKISGIVVATYVITNIPGIKQIQFLQTEYGAVTVNLVKGIGWTSLSHGDLIARIHQYLGKDMQIKIVEQEHIPHEKSGKYRFSISTLSDC